MRAFLEYLHDWIGESGYYYDPRLLLPSPLLWAESIVEQSERGRLSGRPFCAGTGWCAVSPSRRFLTAIGMDHVLTSIAWGPSRRPIKFPLRSYNWH
jgi:hypothetical protein